MIEIDSSKVKGEPGTGYEPSNGKGPFACHNCEFFRDGSCGQETMIKISKLPRTAGGRVQVDPLGCCEYVDRLAQVKKKHWINRRK